MVGRAARILRSSSIFPSFNGTLKSALTRTRFPDGSGRSSSWGTATFVWSLLGADELHQIDQTVGVAPLVVVPAEHLDQVAHGHGERRVEGAAGGRADDVGRHDRIHRVDEHFLQWALRGGRLEGLVDLVHRDVA